MCNSNHIEGFPTVLVTVNGKVSEYDGTRSTDALIKTLNKLISEL
jgi:hypothetical protein